MTPQDRAMLMVYQSVKHRLKMGVAEYIEALKDWDVVPLTEAGRVIGGVLLKGNEIHVGYGEKPKASIRGHIRATLKSVVETYGSAVTRIGLDNPAGIRFCERLGFVKINESEHGVEMRCDRSNFV